MARQADVRDRAVPEARWSSEGVAEFGRLDIVCANAGICSFAENTWTLDDDDWQDMIDGQPDRRLQDRARPASRPCSTAGNGGAIVITSSTAGLKGMAGIAHYTRPSTAWSG